MSQFSDESKDGDDEGLKQYCVEEYDEKVKNNVLLVNQVKRKRDEEIHVLPLKEKSIYKTQIFVQTTSAYNIKAEPMDDKDPLSIEDPFQNHGPRKIEPMEFINIMQENEEIKVKNEIIEEIICNPNTIELENRSNTAAKRQKRSEEKYNSINLDQSNNKDSESVNNTLPNFTNRKVEDIIDGNMLKESERIACKGCRKLVTNLLSHLNRSGKSCREFYTDLERQPLNKQKKYYEKNKELEKKRRKEYYGKNKEKIKEIQRQYDAKRRKSEFRQEKQKQYQTKHSESETSREKQNQYQAKHSESETKREKQKQYNQNYQKRKILKNFESDTGFDVFCSYCNQYKSKSKCSKMTMLTQEQQDEYLDLDEDFNMSEDKEYYVCHYCNDKDGKALKEEDKDLV